MGEEFESDTMSDFEESLDDSKDEIGKKRKQSCSKTSFSKGKKKYKDKIHLISSSSLEEVSEESEKEEPQPPQKKKAKTTIQTRNK